MSSQKILFAGTTGRLGTLISEEMKLENRYSAIPIYRTTEPTEFLKWASLPESVYLDVSLAEGARTRISALNEKKIYLPTVLGCTGFTESDMKLLLDYSEKAPLLIAPNFSVGMTLLVSILEKYSHLLRDIGAEFAIEETHHTQKKDSPSGSAKALKAAVGADAPILSHRIGDVVGQHEVRAHLEHETLKFSHEAHDRRVFARGAMRALSWIMNKKQPGLYSMKDVLALD